jgi:hypothetical protein
MHLRRGPQIFFAAQHFPTSTLLFQHHESAVRAGGLQLHPTRATGATSGALFGCLSNPLCKIETARGNNHRSCIAAPLCKLSCQPFETDHEGPDQARPRPRQPPVPRAVRGHQDTREPGSRSEKFSAESRPLGETITDPVSQPHYASCLAGLSGRITKAQIKPGHALDSPLYRARQRQT